MDLLSPVHPGEVLRTDFLDALGIDASALAEAMLVPVGRVNGILNGKRAITADVAMRLATQLETTPEFWMNLQVSHDLALLSMRAGPLGARRKGTLPARRR
jgi:addiction module HigA family antidote